MNQPTNNQPSDKMSIKEKIVYWIHMILIVVEIPATVELVEIYHAESLDWAYNCALTLFALFLLTLYSLYAWAYHVLWTD